MSAQISITQKHNEIIKKLVSLNYFETASEVAQFAVVVALRKKLYTSDKQLMRDITKMGGKTTKWHLATVDKEDFLQGLITATTDSKLDPVEALKGFILIGLDYIADKFDEDEIYSIWEMIRYD